MFGKAVGYRWDLKFSLIKICFSITCGTCLRPTYDVYFCKIVEHWPYPKRTGHPCNASSRHLWKQPNGQITTEKKTRDHSRICIPHGYDSIWNHKNGQTSMLPTCSTSMANPTHELPSPHPVATFWPRGGFENQDFNGTHVEASSKWDQKLWINLIWLIYTSGRWHVR